MAELLLDPDIRIWVILPIVIITLLVGVLRHYVIMLLHREKRLTLEALRDGQALMRSQRLRANGHFLPGKAFVMRKDYFNDENDGYFKKEKRESPPSNPMGDPTMMLDMVKGNLTNLVPMMVIGGWINWTFSGFVATKVPFPLTTRFKAMLQRGVQLSTLDASWVSSASWYFLNFFGLRSVLTLILGHHEAVPDQMNFVTPSFDAGPDPAKAMKAEWEALQIIKHEWKLERIEEEIIRQT
ncbi:ER membrane protein complex subunit 3-like [Oscarella lobularis]|uniref:ER membrane protein complex subunit 3-like n=1 Tax=Oscarella lobularis TaxID=121494 RepID=UPI003314127E